MVATHGGPGRNQGPKTNAAKGLPRLTWQDYEIIRLPRPANDREVEALEWFKELEPSHRLSLIVKIYYSI